MGEALPSNGDVLAGKYRVERILGRGGMGIVVEALQMELGRRVALKFMRDTNIDGSSKGRFLREARAAAQLRGEHVVRVLDVGSLESGAPYIVMELLEGFDLRGVEQTPLASDDALLYMIQACEGVAEAHAAGVVHRDLKPPNIFVTRTPHGRPCVKVLDFGIAKVTNEAIAKADGVETTSETVIGSPKYMAPEQLTSMRTVDARADVWALGVCLYQCLTARLPFETDLGVVALAAMVLAEPATPPSRHRPDIPPDLEGLIMRCLEKDPSKRFANAAELGAAIEEIARGYGWNLVAPSSRIDVTRISSPSIDVPEGPVSTRGGGATSTPHPSGGTRAVWNRPPASGAKPFGVLAIAGVGALMFGVGIGGIALFARSREGGRSTSSSSAAASVAPTVASSPEPAPAPPKASTNAVTTAEPARHDAASPTPPPKGTRGHVAPAQPASAGPAVARPPSTAGPARRAGSSDDMLNHL